MKKLSCFLLLLGAVALASCTKEDETPVVPEVKIELPGAASAENLSLPQDGTILLKAAVTNSTDYEAVWSVNGEKVSTEEEFEFVAADLGDNLIRLDVTGQNGQKSSAGMTIEVYGKYKHGTFVVNEGNMTTQNGFISFIAPDGQITDSVYYKVNGAFIGNVVQDMYISGDEIFFVSQNGEKMGGEGCFVIADAATLKKKAAYKASSFSNNGWPAHVAVVGKYAFIQGNSGITLYDRTTETFTLIDGTKGAARNNMAVVGEKVFASAGNDMLVLQIQDGAVKVDKVTCPGRIGGIIKAYDGKLWLACGGSPSTVSRVDPADYSFIEKHDVSEVALGLSRRTSPTICAKSDTIYMKAEGDRATQIFRHIFSQNKTVQLIDMKDELENAKQGYNAINVHPVTGEVYINTIKAYGWDFMINDLSVWDFTKDSPVMKADYQNHTAFPAGVYFTDSFN